MTVKMRTHFYISPQNLMALKLLKQSYGVDMSDVVDKLLDAMRNGNIKVIDDLLVIYLNPVITLQIKKAKARVNER
jgi:hypothetical protein